MIYRIRRDDHQELTYFVRLDNYFPRPSGVPSVDDKPPFKNVRTVPDRVFKHATQIDFVERTIFHALQKMGAQLELQNPPRWPRACCQKSLSCPSRSSAHDLVLKCAGEPGRLDVARRGDGREARHRPWKGGAEL